MSDPINLEEGLVPSVQPREIPDEDESPKPEAPKPSKKPKVSKNEIKDEDGKGVKELMEADVVPALVRATDKAADTMAFSDRIAYEKKERDARRKKERMPIKVSGVKTINEY